MYKRKLKKQRHTVSMNTEHLVFSPKYRGKVLGDEVGVRKLFQRSVLIWELG